MKTPLTLRQVYKRSNKNNFADMSTFPRDSGCCWPALSRVDHKFEKTVNRRRVVKVEILVTENTVFYNNINADLIRGLFVTRDGLSFLFRHLYDLTNITIEFKFDFFEGDSYSIPLPSTQKET